MLDAALNISMSNIPDGPGKIAGIALGGQIAEKIVALRSSDGADAKVAFTPHAGAGLYQLTPPQTLPAILPQWGAVTPFVLRSRTGLDLKGAPAITTEQFAREFEEVKSVGARNSTTRTEINVSVTAPGSFGVTRTYRKFSELTEEVDNARVWGGIHFRSTDRRCRRTRSVQPPRHRKISHGRKGIRDAAASPGVASSRHRS
jgi:hypothetical protein